MEEADTMDDYDDGEGGLWRDGHSMQHVDVHTSDTVRINQVVKGALCGAGEAPAGWRVVQEEKITAAVRGGGRRMDKFFISRGGRKLRSLGDVWRFLNEAGSESRDAREECWLRTLNRYGTDCKHWAVASPPLTPLPEAPIFCPTAAECDDLASYIERVTPQFAHAGICRINPPAGWRPKAAPKETGGQDGTETGTQRGANAAAQATAVYNSGEVAGEGAGADETAFKRQRSMGGLAAAPPQAQPRKPGADGTGYQPGEHDFLSKAGVDELALEALQRSLDERGTSRAPPPLTGLEEFQVFFFLSFF
ncbi:hypothetical protein T492DRAFT_138700 [Pavlovales sp. CCMP2436]|nr:hypothetical protein T492DRAFT_138700 [Pavlovales sp. CCMP2436]